MQSWKFTIKPDSEEGFDSFLKCKELGIVGIGWHHGYKEEQPRDHVHAKELRSKIWGHDIAPVETLFSKIQPGDHLWTHRDGVYYLCIAGARHFLARDICEDFWNYDLGHAIEAKWIKIPDEFVTGSIQRGVIARKMIQRINLTDAEIRMNLHLQKNLQIDPGWLPVIENVHIVNVVNKLAADELFGLMSPDDIEDLVAAKLQTEGWVLIKSTCFRSKPKFEFSMINKDGITGLVQVKSGNRPDDLPPAKFQQYLTEHNEVFLFSTNPNPYPGICPKGITLLSKEKLVQWMKDNYRALSPTIKLKLSVAWP